MRPADIRDPYLRKNQARYDEVHFDEHPYALESKGISHADAKVAHIAYHVGKLPVKFDKAMRPEATDENRARLAKEVLPDALMFRTQIANTLRFDLFSNLDPVPINTTLPYETGMELLMDALGPLLDFAEPLEHRSARAQDRRLVRQIAIPALHEFGMMLVYETNQVPQEAHAERLLGNIKSGQFIKPVQLG